MDVSLRTLPADQRDRLEASLNGKWAALEGHLDERSRRLWLGAEAKDLGYGGVAFVAAAAGVARGTITLGAAGLAAGPLEPGRIRRAGAGRKRAGEAGPELASELDALVEPGSRGDPCAPLRWTTLSLASLSAGLGRRGFAAGPALIGRLLKQLGYSLQANAKTREGRQHPGRDGQFRYINDLAAQRLAAGEPVISIDVKEKENIGDCKNAGTGWRPSGGPLEVDAYDFIGPDGKAVPHGIYDIGASTGWMAVGISAGTSEFAVRCLLGWWGEAGKAACPDATTLTITADCGGSSSSRGRLWKKQLARFSDQAGIAVTVLHYPPGTSSRVGDWRGGFSRW